MTEDDEVPKHQKRADKSKPWVLEFRVHPEYRKGEDLVFLNRDWSITRRFKTEEQALQAKAGREKSDNHGSHVCAVFFEYRVVKP